MKISAATGKMIMSGFIGLPEPEAIVEVVS